MLNLDHKPQQVPSPYGHWCPVWDIIKMHGHGFARVERVRSNIFWCKAELSCSDMNGLGPQDRNDVRGADQAETLSGRIVAVRGGS